MFDPDPARTTPISVMEIIAPYFVLFDNMFFFGSLAGNVDFFLRSEVAGSGWAWTREHPPHVQWVMGCRPIEITFFLVPTEGKTIVEVAEQYIGTLLHEMIHAFMVLYGCKQSCCRRQFEEAGKSGHGVAWLDAATRIERGWR